MNAQDSKAEVFDVFLCHNNVDKPAVREIARMLVKEGIKPWLDEDQIRPGTSWQTALGEQIESIRSVAVFVGKNGIGPWQDEEIQAFLSEFMRRKCPVIPTVLVDATKTPELPWTLRNRHWVDFRVSEPDPLGQLIWGITGVKSTAAEPLIAGREDNAAPRARFSESRYYLPLAQAPDQEQAIQLEILRRRVMEYWVDGVLKHSLYNEVLISLDRRGVANAIDAPWKYTVEVSDAMNSGLLDDRDVSVIYDTTGLMLILGEPGSGKTTTLLDLARTLLERARDDIKERVPVVVNLSSWKKQPLREWISIELSEKYRVPRKIARFWLQNNYLLPLLDWLDEVSTALQPDCVTAINAFIDEMSPSGLVVCCRLNEYQWLPKRLKLNGAICLEPLSSEEVSKYLDAGGAKLAALREAVDRDPVFQELAQTPLMLSVMSLAYQGAGGSELATQKGSSPEERRKQIFRLYVEQMLQRKGTASLVFPKEKIIGWLSWLARKMREHSQSVFLVEGLQPSWLDTRAKRVAYGTVVALSLGLIFGMSFGLSFGLNSELIMGEGDVQIGGPTFGLIFGLIILVGVDLGCWSKSPSKNAVVSGSISGLIFGVIYGLIYGPSFGLGIGLIAGLTAGAILGLIGGLGTGSLNQIILVETISWKWNRFWKRTIPGSILGLIVGLILGLIGGLIDGLNYGGLNYVLNYVLNYELINMLSVVLICGLIFALVSGLVSGFTDRVKVGKAFPNQGIKLSIINSLTALFVTFLTVGTVLGLIFGLRLKLSAGFSTGLSTGLSAGLIVGLIVGLNRGGSAVIKHYALRLILWLKGYTPLNIIKFLDQSAKLILLKKVGGGYIFIHRMLLDYFAEMTPQSTRVEDGTTGSVEP
jgi:hypothetical protein